MKKGEETTRENSSAEYLINTEEESNEQPEDTRDKGKAKIREGHGEREEGEVFASNSRFSIWSAIKSSSWLRKQPSSTIEGYSTGESESLTGREPSIEDESLIGLPRSSATPKHYSYWLCTNFLISIALLALLSDLIFGILEEWPSKPLNKLGDEAIDGIEISIGFLPFLLMFLDFFITYLFNKFGKSQLTPINRPILHVDVSSDDVLFLLKEVIQEINKIQRAHYVEPNTYKSPFSAM